MKRIACVLAVAALLGTTTACHHHNVNTAHCAPCQEGTGHASNEYIPHLPPNVHHHGVQGPAGPPAASYAYPYYTVRGPRDFFLDNPATPGN